MTEPTRDRSDQEPSRDEIHKLYGEALKRINSLSGQVHAAQRDAQSLRVKYESDGEVVRPDLADDHDQLVGILDEVRTERNTFRGLLARLAKWLSMRSLDPVTLHDAVDRAIELLPEACGDDHHVGDKPDDCYACLAVVTTNDIEWLRDLANVRLAKNRQRGNVNSWTCKTCGAVLWCVDHDEGVTPMIVLCQDESCGGEAVSAFYQVGLPGAAPPPTHRWIRPRSLAGLDPGTRQHVVQGGLVLEEIPERERSEPAAAPVEELLGSGSRREGADIR